MYVHISMNKLFIPAETWFAVLFTVLVEIVPAEIRSLCIGIFLFLMNNIGGNLPTVVAVVSDATNNLRTALYIFFPGLVGASKLRNSFTCF